MARDTSLYRIDGQRVPSVTEVLRLAGFDAPLDTTAVAIARDRGQRVHAWCDAYHHAGLDGAGEVAPDIAGYVTAYLKWCAECRVELIASEQVVVSEQYYYAGTMDLAVSMVGMKLPPSPVAVDLKCVATVQPETRLQLAGYAVAAGIKRRASVQLRRDGKYRLLEYEKESDVYDWLACVRTAHFKLFHRLATLID